MRLFVSVAAMLCIAGSAFAQIPIPTHSSVYNGFSRGFNFTAQTTFIISQLQLPPEAMQAGDTGSFLVRVNGTTALRTVGVASGSITPNLLINTGDVVDIIGNWSPATTGNFTAHNSYGSSAPFASMIQGVPHTLMRTGWQWDVGDAGWTTAAYLAPTTGSIGRVFMHTAAPQGYASVQDYGQGCYRATGTFYENFATSTVFDLSNSGFSMIYTGTGYTVIPLVSAYVPPSPTATVLTLADDAETTVTLGSALPIPNGTTTALNVCSNGYVSNGSNGVGYTPSGATFMGFANTCWAASLHDYNPSGGSYIKFEEVGPISYITYENIPDFGVTGSASTFQYQFDRSSGIVHIVYGVMSLTGNGHLTGFHPAGSTLDPGSIDLSAALPATFACGVDIRPIRLAAAPRPVLGNTVVLTTSDIPAGSVLGATILSFTQHNPGIDASIYGMPGCFQYVGLDATQVFLVSGTSGSTSLALPTGAQFSGMNLYAQSVVFVAGANPLGAQSSNGVALLTGTQ